MLLILMNVGPNFHASLFQALTFHALISSYTLQLNISGLLVYNLFATDLT